MNPSFTQNDFKSFLKKAFETLHPTKNMISNWHLDLICSYLDSIKDSYINKMIFNLPPRALKSITINVAWIAWLLGVAPDKKIISISYNQELSNKHARDCRLIMQSDWYKKLFPETIIARGFNKINKFYTTKGGFRLSTSPQGTLTGEGADLIIIDDPISAVDVLSYKKRQKLNYWFNNALLSRLNDPNRGQIIVVMQRLHYEDLTGHLLLQNSGWQKLIIPAIAEEDATILHRDFHYLREKGEGLYDNISTQSGINPKKTRQNLLTQISFNQLKVAYKNISFTKIPIIDIKIPQIPYCNFTTPVSNLNFFDQYKLNWFIPPKTAINSFVEKSVIISFPLQIEKNTTSSISFYQLKQEIGREVFNIQYQQKVVKQQNPLIHKEWLRYYSEFEPPSIGDYNFLTSAEPLDLGNFELIYQSWDCAVKPGDRNDFTVCSSWGVKNNRLYLLNILKLKVDYPNLRKVVLNMANLFKVDGILIEDSAAGAQLIQEITQNYPLMNLIMIKPKLDKITRFTLISHLFEKGLVLLPKSASWLSDFLSEIFNFPDTMHDDQVDSITQFLSWYHTKTKNCNYKFNIL
jgi:predicted phage terminase large subunit-like protein